MAFARAFQNPSKVLAIDMDDVFADSKEDTIARYNRMYGSQVGGMHMTLDHAQWYWWWRNPGWGRSQAEAQEMVIALYANGEVLDMKPKAGAKEALLSLKEQGYKLVMVTSRMREGWERDESDRWLDIHFPDVFEKRIFCGGNIDLQNPEPDDTRNRMKPGVCHEIGAMLLMRVSTETYQRQTLTDYDLHSDDSIEHAVKCADANPPVPVLLFGNYPWNKYPCEETPEHARMAAERYEKGLTWKEHDPGHALPDCVKRVKDWNEVLKFFEEQEAAAARSAAET